MEQLQQSKDNLDQSPDELNESADEQHTEEPENEAGILQKKFFDSLNVEFKFWYFDCK